MTSNKRNAGFTLIELMIVVAIIAVIAAVAIPKLMSARISANENAAIATLRSIAAAQQQIQASAAIDTDGDGGGEYAFFGELAGAVPMRVFAGGILPPIAGGVTDVLNPPFLATAFGNVAGGIVERQGYNYQVFLPGVAAAALPGLAEAPTGGTLAANLGTWNSADTEIIWCAYAWPTTSDKTGVRAFFINQEGDVISFNNRDNSYNGAAGPAFSAAYDVAPVANSMNSGLALSVMGRVANDGNLWTQVGN